jgi:hypothetical protein
MKNLTWRDVYDTYKIFERVGTAHDVLPLLHRTGYHYFIWNDRVYEETRWYTSYEDTGLTVEDLEKCPEKCSEKCAK